MSFREKIKDLRIEHNFSQKELADNLKLSQSCITKLEKGLREPTGSTLYAYSRFFNVSIDFLMDNEDVPAAVPHSANVAAMPETLSDDEKELLKVFRGLSETGKKTLIGSAHNIEKYDPQATAKKKA